MDGYTRDGIASKTVARWVCSVLALLLVWPCVLHGRYTTARLSGYVSDSSGSIVPNATVTVENPSTGYKQTVKTAARGEYLFPSLPVGTYQLTVVMNGFATYQQSGIGLAVGQSAAQNVKLAIGASSQRVVVTANSTLVTTDTSMVTQLIGQKSIVNLPLNGRDVQQLVFLAPGATNVTSHYCAANCIFR